MKNCVFKIVFLLFILHGFKVTAQTETTNLCSEIYGEWKTYYIHLPFDGHAKDSETWIFNRDNTLTVNGRITSYVLEDDCSKLFIENIPSFFSIRMANDTLYMFKRILLHESYGLRLKKIN